MPNIAKDCHENKKNKSSKNELNASKYAEIEVQKLNDKNFIRMPRQYMPFANGRVCVKRYSKEARAGG